MGLVPERLEQQVGVGRSLLIYYCVPGRLRQLQRFYEPLVRPGELCFDIGAHVGNRIAAWTRLGARVVAVEPQAHLMSWLQRFYGHNAGVTLVQRAVGAEAGTAQLMSSRRNPTVATLSREWQAQVRQDDSFSAVRWNTSDRVTVTTLDNLIAAYGRPALCKIDVEGFEAEVLHGLSEPLPLISFEYIPAAIEIAHACIRRLAALGAYEYNSFVGETHRWSSPAWLTPEAMHTRLEQLAGERRSGDVFARKTQSPEVTGTDARRG